MSKPHDLARRASSLLSEGRKWGNRDMGAAPQHQHKVGDRVHMKDAQGKTAKRGKVAFLKSGYGSQHLHVHWDGEAAPGRGSKSVPGHHVHPGEG